MSSISVSRGIVESHPKGITYTGLWRAMSSNGYEIPLSELKQLVNLLVDNNYAVVRKGGRIYPIKGSRIMAKARKKTAKKASKKTAKKTRTPAQVAATKRLVAANKARAKGKKVAKKTSRKKTAKKTTRRHSQAYWAKWASKQQPAMTASGHMIHSGPMTRAQDTAARKAAKVMGGRKKTRKRSIKYTGEYFPAPRGKVYGPTRADYVGPILPKSHTRKTRKKVAKVRTVTANQILGTAAKASKFHKLAVWVCANPSGRRTGCGGGKRGGHVVGILR